MAKINRSNLREGEKMKKVGDDVKFASPVRMTGKTKAIAYYPSGNEYLDWGYGKYKFFAELIQFKNEESIRLGYYRNGKFAGQWSFTLDTDNFVKFVKEISQKEKWFKDLLYKGLQLNKD